MLHKGHYVMRARGDLAISGPKADFNIYLDKNGSINPPFHLTPMYALLTGREDPPLGP